MASNQGNFIPMAGPERNVFEVLAELIDFECAHTDKEHKIEGTKDPICERVTLTNLEETAVRIADMIDKGEL